MDKSKVGLRSLLQEPRSGGGGPSTSFGGSRYQSDEAHILIRAPPGRVVSLSTCAKVCLVSFAVGVFVGFTLKRSLRRWAAKLLKRIKDD